MLGWQYAGKSAGDLHATNPTIGQSSYLEPGGSLQLNWNDTNAGSSTLSGSWTDLVTITNPANDQVIASEDVSVSGASLAAGQSEAKSTAISIPKGVTGYGSLDVTVLPDSAGTFLETNSDGTPGYESIGQVAVFLDEPRFARHQRFDRSVECAAAGWKGRCQLE